MRLVICGAGQVGDNLIHYLYLDYDIIIIDIDPLRLDWIKEQYDVQTIHGNAADPCVLAKAQLTANTGIIAVTPSDEVNVMACQVSNLLGQTAFRSARIRNKNFFLPEWHKKVLKKFGLNFIFSPEQMAAFSILESFETPYSFDSFSFGKSGLILIGVQIGPQTPFIHHTLARVYETLSAFNLKIIRIIRNYNAFIPLETDTINLNDAIYFVTFAHQKNQIMQMFSDVPEASRSVILFGASSINASIVEALLKKNFTFTVIDDSIGQMTEFFSLYPNIRFLKGSPLNHELLEEAKIHEANYAISATADDTLNILSGLMAHSYGVTHCLALVQGIRYISSLFAMGIEKIVNPHHLLIGTLLQKLTKEFITSFYLLQGDESGTVIEAFVNKGAPILSAKPSEIEDHSLRIIAIIRKKKVLWSTNFFQLGDHVIVTTMPEGYQKFHLLFSSGV